MSEQSYNRRQLLDRPIAYHRCLVRFAGIPGAVFLSQALFWSNIKNGDWFYKTNDEWEQETGIGRKSLQSIREQLKSLGILNEDFHKVNGSPKVHFQVNEERIFQLLESNYAPGKPELPPTENGRFVKNCSRPSPGGNVDLPAAGTSRTFPCGEGPYKESETTTETTYIDYIPPTPLVQKHSEQPEPEQSSQVATPDYEITIDNISEKLHTRLCEMKTGATKANTKSRARIERAYAVIGATKIFERFEAYLAQGGKSLDDFAKSFSAVQKQRERGGFGSRTPQAEFPSASRQSASSDRPAIRPSAFVAPAEVGDWNHQIPELACAAWDRNYQGLWDRAVSEKMLDFWPKILENAKAAQAGKHERGGFLSLDWVLRNWAKTANGGLSWMTAAVDDAATVSKATSTPRYGLAEAMAEARRQGIISSPSAS